MNKNLAIVWITFRGDASALEISIRQARRVLPDASLHVIDDARNPVPDDVRGSLKSGGIDYSTTNANRNRNLRGMEWVTTQVRCMADIARETGADAVLKLDSDTMLIDPAWLLESLADKSKLAIGTRSVGRHGDQVWLYGAGYAVRAKALFRLEKEVDKLPSWAMDHLVIMPNSVHEDVFVTRLVYLLYGMDAMAISEWRLSGAWFAGWQYKEGRKAPEQRTKWLRVYAQRYGCVTFGNRYQIKSGDPRKEVVKTMLAMEELVQDGDSISEPLPHFLHVPKTGGESVKKAINDHGLVMIAHPHSTDGEGLSGEVIAVWRDPVDRFRSAFRWFRNRHKGDFNRLGLHTPGDLALALRDGREDVDRLITSPSQKVGGVSHGWDYIFLAQSLWLENATKIIPFTSLPEWFEGRFGQKLPRINTTAPAPDEYLPLEAEKWIMEHYAEDYAYKPATGARL